MANGFIIDAPNVLIKNSSGVSQIVTAKQGEVKFGSDSLAIQGGWSFYDLMDIDTKKSIEVSLQNAQMQMNTIALQNGTTVKTGAKERFIFGKKYIVKTNKTKLPHIAVTGSVLINGYTETSETVVATKQFKVTIGESDTDIEFFAGDMVDGTEIEIVYRVSVADAEAVEVLASDFGKTAQFIMEYPVYGKNEADEEDILGYIQINIFKAKLKSEVTIGGQYKNASEFTLNAKGLDPRRADEKVFEINFFPKVA